MAVRVLMLDDDTVHLELSQKFLRRQSSEYQIATAETYGDAIEMLDSEVYDAAVCDIDLAQEEHSGLEVLEHIRSKGRDIPVIIFTGKSREEFAIQALNLGADYYIRKSATNIENLYAELSYYILTAVEKRRTQRALTETEIRAQTYLDTAGTVIIAFDKNLRITMANKKACEVLETSESDLLGKDWVSEFIPESDREHIKSYLNNLLDGKVTPDEKEEGAVLTPSGNKIIEWYDSVLRDAAGQVVGIISAGPEITDRKKTEGLLEEERNKARRYLDLADTVLLALDRSFNVTMINRKGCHLIGLEEDEILGKNWLESFVADERKNEARDYLVNLVEHPEDQSPGCIMEIVTSDGTQRTIECHESVIRDDEGEAVSILCSAREILTVEGLSYSDDLVSKSLMIREEWWQRIFDSSPTAIVFFDSKGRYIDANKAALDFFRARDKESLAGLDLFKGILLPRSVLQSLDEKGEVGFEYQLDMRELNKELDLGGRDEHSIIAGGNITKIEDSEETLSGFIVHLNDITEKRKIEELHRSNEEMFRTIFEESPISIEIFDADCRLIAANKTALDMFGVTDEEEILGFDLTEDPNVSEVVMDSLRAGAAIRTEERFDFDLVKRRKLYKTSKSGVIYLESVFSPLVIGGETKGYITHIQDVTAKQQAEKLLKESRERFKELYSNALTGLFRVRASDSLILECNDQFASLLGHSQARELLDDTSFFRAHLEKPARWDSLKERCRDVNRFRTDLRITKRDGSKIWVRLSLRAAPEKGFLEGVMADITQEMNALELLEKQKHELSEFAHAMSHDMKNIFHNMIGFIELAEDENDLRHLKKLKALIHDTGELLDHSVALAEAGVIVDEAEEVELDTIVRDVAESIIPADVEYAQSRLPIVEADKKKVAQIFRNLLDNAIIHGEPKRVEVSSIKEDGNYLIRVRNDGKEIPEAIRQKIFKRGFTTSKSGRGFGLAIVRRLVEAHGWTISLLSQRETTFEIRIPTSSYST
ncbi:PAS domain S-box protein [Candidatus Thorarchaeota archaeon]|nr:MAG: PAS domain S-box protein [Candidatus Thorarchaeota archaeon]